MTELSPPKSVDPLTVLPRELAEQILNYLNFKQLMNTCLVSPHWAQFIRRTPNLWRHLDLTLAKRKVKSAFISRAINIGRSKLKTVTLRNLFDFDLALAALTKSCPLEEINLRDTGVHTDKVSGLLKPLKNLRSLSIGSGTKLYLASIHHILKNAAATLESLYIEDFAFHAGYSELQFPVVAFPNMHELDLSWRKQGPSAAGLQAALNNMPNLRRLKLHHLHPALPSMAFERKLDLKQLKHLSQLDLVWHFQIANELALPPSLKSFALGTWRPKHAKFFDVPLTQPYEPLQWPLPSLEELHICIQEIKLDTVEQHALRPTTSANDGTPSLIHTLSITSGDLQGVPVKDFLSHPRLKELKHLNLKSCHGLDDDQMSSVASCLPLLQSLDVSGTDVTGAGIKDVIKNGLKKLVVNDCRYLGLDAVHWARNQGVKVEYRSIDLMTGGKKLRY
jgi:F-box/TPR repeat protein Pof3